jgi:DNA-binding transcriptional LysR family regulator
MRASHPAQRSVHFKVGTGGLLLRQALMTNGRTKRCRLLRKPIGVKLIVAISATLGNYPKMIRMSSIALKYFMEVARTGSIAAASERIHVAGSAVSRQIAALEHEIGTALFIRQSRGMVLTEAGEELASHVRRSILEEERVISEIRTRGARTVGRINIATSLGLASHFMAASAREYRERFSGIRFTIRAQSPEDIIERIKLGEVDVGVAFASGLHPGVLVRHRIIVPTCVILSASHRLAGSKTLTLEQIRDYPIATSMRSTVRNMIDLRSAVAGIELNVVFECDYSDALFDYCSSGDAITFATEVSVRNWISRGQLVAIQFKDPKLFERNIEIQAMEGRTLPAYVEDWIGFLATKLEKSFPSKKK